MVNGAVIKTNYKAVPGDTIEVTIPELEELDAVAEEMDLDIYYEDADVLVVNKPSGMVVHPAPGHVSGTLVNGLMAHCKDLLESTVSCVLESSIGSTKIHQVY